MMVHWLWAPAGALAFVLLVSASRLNAWRSGAWAAIGVLGQAATLQLIKAGPLVGYQHLSRPGEAWLENPVALVVAAAFLAAAVAGIAARRSAIAGWVRGRPRAWTWLVALGAGSLLAAAPSASPSLYVTELALAALLQLAALACVALAATGLPDESVAIIDARLARWLGAAADAPGRDPFAWAVAALVVVVSAALCLASYRAIPHIPDEIAYLVQARYFAAGLPWLSPPPVPEGFETFLLEVAGDRWYSVFPPGWPLVLAVGVKLGVPWLVNPLLGGLCILLAYRFIRELGDRGEARLAIVLLAASPWHLLLSMSFMSHQLSLALALVTGLGTLRAWRTGAWPPALAAGLSLGVLGMSRPLEGVAIGALAGIPMIVAMTRGAWRPLVSGAMGMLLTGGLGLAYNKVITGSMLVFPAERYFDRVYGPGKYGIGFGPEKGVGWTGLDPFPGHGLVDVGVNAVLNGFMVNVDLFGWLAGSIALVVAGALAARGSLDRLMVTAIITVTGLHGAYWFSGGPDFGARYWFLIIVPCVVLAGRALQRLEGGDTGLPGGRTMAAASLLIAASLVLYLPWRAVDKYANYRGIRAEPVAWARDARFRDALILVKGNRHPDLAGAVIANAVPVDDHAPLFAWDRDEGTRRAVLEAYPDRVVWLVNGPTVTGDGYRIVQGPVRTSERHLLSASGDGNR